MNIKKIIALSTTAMMVTLLPACSTVMNGGNQAVTFNTGEVSEANCTITGGSDNAVQLDFVSPAEVKLPRSKKALNVMCSKAGYADATQIVNSKVEASTAGNIITGGIIGVGVDALTGALYKYPDVVQIMMHTDP